jgi:hypothetical protein
MVSQRDERGAQGQGQTTAEVLMAMLKAIHAQEDRQAAREKAQLWSTS